MLHSQWWYGVQVRLVATPRYWHIRTALSKLAFRLKRRRFVWGQDLASGRLQLRIFVALARTVGFAAGAALALLVFVEGLGRLADVAGLHFGLGSVRSDLAFDPVFIGTIALGATLLGLYFAGLSFIVTARYASAPANVRELILTERIGSTYVRLVSLAVAAAAWALVFEYLGATPGTLIAGTVVVLAAISIMSFGAVGLRMFLFLGFVELASLAAYDIDRALGAAASKSLGREFEDYHRRRLSDSLGTYHEILRLAADCESSRQVERMALALIERCRTYEESKPRIPSDSWWFERQQVHGSWWVADDSEVGLALNTGTELPPRQELDHSWVEKRFIEILRDAVGSLAGREEIEPTHNIAISLARNARPMAASLQIDDAIRSLEILTSQPLLAPSAPHASGKSSATTKRNALLDDVAYYVTNLVLGLQDAATTITAEGFWSQLDEALETGKTRAGSPLGAVLDLVAQLRERLDFERQAEGRRLTPSWWIRQQVANNLYRELDRGLDKTLTAFGTEVIQRAKDATDPIDAVTLASRALEIANKLAAHGPALEATLAALDETRRASDDWPTRTSADMAPRTRKYFDDAVDVFAKRMPELPAAPVNGQPDFFGQAFYVLVNQCFAALVGERDDRFVALFPPILDGAMAAHDYLMKAFPLATHGEDQLILRSGVIEDIFEISGYALIRGELGDTTVWARCQSAWDDRLTKMANRAQVLEMLMALMDYRHNLFALLPREVIRTSRHMAFGRYLAAKLGVSEDWSPGFGLHRYFPDQELPEPHPSPIVQLALEGFTGEPEAIFEAQYIAPQLPKGFELPRQVRDVLESLELRQRPSIGRRPRARRHAGKVDQSTEEAE